VYQEWGLPRKNRSSDIMVSTITRVGYDASMTTENDQTRQPSMKDVAVIIPCYNAGARLRPVLDTLRSFGVVIIVVDDGSTDGSTEIGNTRNIRLVRFDTNRGKGHALLAGMEAALNGPVAPAVVVLMDADGQHDAANLVSLVAAVTEEGADLAIGQRDFRFFRIPFASWLGNRVTSLLAWLFLGRWIHDTQCGYRALSPRFARAVLKAIPGGRYETETAMLALAILGGYRVRKIPVSTRYESGNRSSHFRKGVDSFRVLAELVRAARRYRNVSPEAPRIE